MVALRTDPDVVDSSYLYYRLRAPDARRAIEGMHVGTMIPHFKKGDFGRLLLSVNADIREQRAIAAVLGALDDKIAANERITRIADELSQALWNQAISSGEVVPLSRLATFVNGRAFTKGASGTGRVVVRIAELNSGIGPSTVYNDIDVADEHLVSPGDILFAWSGSLTVARWYRHEAIVNQHIFKVIPSEGYPKWLVNQALRSKLDEFKAIASDKATTMGHIQRRHLDEPVTIPPPDSVSHLNNVMDALWAVALAAEIETVELAKTRDELLPLLMGGRIPIQTAVDDFKDAV
jgi:type I restriction enzyme S subunit